ncbi:MAG: sigma-70 family RNA polymerase sigma factor [Saprospiraceae bacterium]|nr:sigma-70 family RNA polymerase sigma factor [Saprospiraceae bacterium]
MEYTRLIKRCKEGNRKAQKELYDHFAGRMFFLCQRYAKDQTEAQDMLQEGFVRLFGNLEKFEGKGSFEGWARRIFVNTAIKYYHRVRKHNGHDELGHAEAQKIDPDALSSLHEQELLGLVQELPEGYRAVFNLYAIEGYSHKEIADLLEIQESTSRSQLVKARKLLQMKIHNLQIVLL